jgi:hypothetical protein
MGLLDKAKKLKDINKTPEDKAIEAEEKEWEKEIGLTKDEDGKMNDRQEPRILPFEPPGFL